MKQTGIGRGPQRDTGRCVRIDTEVAIDRAPEVVFDYVTTPALWKTWHPATVSVREAPNRPLWTGETLVEHIQMFGHRDEIQWTVLSCESPKTWEIGTDHRNGTARIKYVISETEGGCRFHRTLTFRAKRWPLRLFASTLIRWMFVRQSTTALQSVKSLLTRHIQGR